MENDSSFLIFRVTCYEANSPKLLQALSFCNEFLTDKIFKIREDGLLVVQPEKNRILQVFDVLIDLGYNHMENANKISVMARLWSNREPSIYENMSIAPTIHVDGSPSYQLFVARRRPFVPWFCPGFKIS